jgi:hypothetical protein
VPQWRNAAEVPQQIPKVRLRARAAVIVDVELGFADNGSCRAASALQPRAVVHGLSESLCAAQVSLGGLDGHFTSRIFEGAGCCSTAFLFLRIAKIASTSHGGQELQTDVYL